MSKETSLPAGLNIAALERRTGVPADTLRKWERRYGVLAPERTDGGQRRYDDLDVARVEWLRERLAEGYRIGEAAALLGASKVGAARTPAELRRTLYDSVLTTDVGAMHDLLDQAFALYPLGQTLLRIVEPVLELVGEGWAAGELSVVQEHLFSNAVGGRIERLLADGRAEVRGVAVLACVPGERHELGLAMLGALLRADGWQVAYLGADAPLEDVAELAERVDAGVVCLSVTMREHAIELARLHLPRGTRLAVGGRAATVRVARRLGAVRLSDGVRRSVRELRRFAR